MGIFKPVWLTDNPSKESKAIAEVRKMTDQVLLVKVVWEAPLCAVRLTAVKQLTDQSSLFKVAMDDRLSEEFRVEALKRISDQDLLFKLATKARTSHTLSRSSYESVLSGNTDWCVRAAAIARIDSDERLAAVAQDPDDDSDGPVRYVKGYGGVLEEMRGLAVERIRDIDTLKKLALYGRTYEVRDSAVWRLAAIGAGESTLRDIALHADHYDSREAAMFAIYGFSSTGLYADKLAAIMEDQDMLYDFVCNSVWCGPPTWAVEKAVKRLSDPDRLTGLIDYNPPTRSKGYLKNVAESRLCELRDE